MAVRVTLFPNGFVSVEIRHFFCIAVPAPSTHRIARCMHRMNTLAPQRTVPARCTHRFLRCTDGICRNAGAGRLTDRLTVLVR